MTTQFDEWLAQLRRTGRLMPRDRVTLVRGQDFKWPISMTGNWSDYTLASSLRLYPDAAGDALLVFTIAPLGYDATSGRTSWQFTASASAVSALPSDGDGDGVVDLAMDVLVKPAGGAFSRLMAGVATVSGKVTNAS